MKLQLIPLMLLAFATAFFLPAAFQPNIHGPSTTLTADLPDAQIAPVVLSDITNQRSESVEVSHDRTAELFLASGTNPTFGTDTWPAESYHEPLAIRPRERTDHGERLIHPKIPD